LQTISLITTAAAMYLTIRMFRGMMQAEPQGTADAVKRLESMLHTRRKLVLSPHERQLCHSIFDASGFAVSEADVAGHDEVLQELNSEMGFASEFPTRSTAAMLATSKGVLLYGPPGTGKTMVAKVRSSMGPQGQGRLWSQKCAPLWAPRDREDYGRKGALNARTRS
jgi:ATP-dependent Zn protease